MVVYCGKHYYRVIDLPGDFFEIRKAHLEKFPYSDALPKKYYWLAEKLFKMLECENDNYIVISSDNPEVEIEVVGKVDTKKQLVLHRYTHDFTKKIRYRLTDARKTFIGVRLKNRLPKEGEIRCTIQFFP